MILFWKNVFQLQRFFITSLLGLVLIILNPIINQAKKSNINAFFTILIFVFALSLIFNIVNSMLNI
jgi:hypothetical protein